VWQIFKGFEEPNILARNLANKIAKTTVSIKKRHKTMKAILKIFR